MVFLSQPHAPSRAGFAELAPSARLAEHGVSLIVVLLILVVVSILGVGAAQMALLGERASRYDRDYQVAWQAADSGTMDAIDDINGKQFGGASSGGKARQARGNSFVPKALKGFEPGCGSNDGQTAGMCEQSENPPIWQTVEFTGETNAIKDGARYAEFGDFTNRQFMTGSVGVQPAHKPRYVIENLADFHMPGESPTDPEASYYRITVLGFGPRQETQVALQSIYRKAAE